MILLKIIAALFLSSLIHECGHGIAAIMYGRKIYYLRIFGGPLLFKKGKFQLGCIPLFSYIKIDLNTQHKIPTIVIYAAGIALQLIFALSFCLSNHGIQFLDFLTYVLLASAILNLLPIKNTDGYRILNP